MTDIKENTSGQGESMESMLEEALGIYREIEELQSQINEIYTKASNKIINTKYEDKHDEQNDRDYFECIESYVRN